MKLLIILFGFLCVLSSRFKDDDKVVSVRYVLLDRNSQGVQYREYMEDSTFIKITPRSWKIKQREKKNSSEYFEEGICFCSNEEKRGRDIDTIRKMPVCILDSIRYYDEKWVRDSFLCGANKVYILDKTTIENDSIVMYEVQVFRYECAEHKD